MLIQALALIRLVQYLPFVPLALLGDVQQHPRPLAVTMLFVVGSLWSTVMFMRGLRVSRIRSPWLVGDIAIHAAIVVAIVAVAPPGGEHSAAQWSLGPAGSAVVVTVVLGSLRAGIAGLAVVIAAYITAVWPVIESGGAATSVAVNVVVIGAFAIVAALVAHSLRTTAATAERALGVMVKTQRSHAAVHARLEEKAHQHRMLHDSVLPTLVGISRGGLDYQGQEIRERCARDAEYVRALISSTAEGERPALAQALGAEAQSASGFGLRVRQHIGRVPETIPPEVVEAIALAVREALNNVIAHARTPQVWLHAATFDAGKVTVTVTDRGLGFDPAAVTTGSGIRRSIKDRVRDVGAVAKVDSVQGEGTTVEITWPRP